MSEEKIIKSITLKIDDVTLTLDIDKAKKLKAALEDMFGKEIIHEVVRDRYYPYWEWRWSQPYYYGPYCSETALLSTQGVSCGACNATYVSGNVTLTI